MNETSKATRRRSNEGEFLGADGKKYRWLDVFKGKGLDVGCGPDKLPFENCHGFDGKDGDANKLSTYFDANNFDYLHGSQVLEHMHNPEAALRDWFRVVKPGGFIIQTVPDVGAYENFHYPSKYNQDHKASFSIIYRGSCFPIHICLPDFLKKLEDISDTLLCRYVEANYDWRKRHIDQTWVEKENVEIWNEFVLRKK